MKYSIALVAATAVAFVAPEAEANDNGKALTPPLGWRSWNLYGANVNREFPGCCCHFRNFYRTLALNTLFVHRAPDRVHHGRNGQA